VNLMDVLQRSLEQTRDRGAAPATERTKAAAPKAAKKSASAAKPKRKKSAA